MIGAGIVAFAAGLIAAAVIGGALSLIDRLVARRAFERRRPAPQMIALWPRPVRQRIEVIDASHIERSNDTAGRWS